MHIVRKHFELLDSTNNWVKLHGEELDPEALTLVSAAAQSGGRGRFNRKWHSPAGLNVYATYAFFLEGMRGDLGNLPQVLALSTAEILEKGGFKPELKWPNDVQIGGKKLAGILAETTWIGNKLLVVLGIGMNVNMPEDLLREIDRPATSLLVEGAKEASVEEWLERLTEEFARNLEVFLRKNFGTFLERYRRRLVHQVGDKVRFHDNQKIWEGYYMGLREDGALKLEVDGQEKVFIAGEILI